MRRVVVAAATYALSSTFAVAAGMPIKASPAAIIVDWSGYYVGVNGGYAFGGGVGPTVFTTSVPQTFTATGSTFNANGAFGGGQIGYNWQNARIVLGVEADIQGAAIRSNINGGVTVFADVYSGYRDLDYFGTVRGRVGYTFDRTLFYATGGFAYGGLRQNISSPNAGWIATQSNVGTGFVAGGGVEYAFSRVWSIKAEYQYIDLGRETLTGDYSGGGITIQTNDLSTHFSTVRIGLNYKFGSGP